MPRKSLSAAEEQIEREAVAMFAAEERLPGVGDDDTVAVKPFLRQCRASTSKTKDGAFTFAADPCPEDLETALEREAA